MAEFVDERVYSSLFIVHWLVIELFSYSVRVSSFWFQVSSCRFQVASCRFQVTSCQCSLRSPGTFANGYRQGVLGLRHGSLTVRRLRLLNISLSSSFTTSLNYSLTSQLVNLHFLLVNMSTC